MMHVRWCAFLIMVRIFTCIMHPRENLEFVLRVYIYVTAALCRCMEVIYIQHMKVLLLSKVCNQRYTVLKPLFFWPEASGRYMYASQLPLEGWCAATRAAR